MSKEANRILELHFGSDFWKIKKSEYYENIINAINEALSQYPKICANCETPQHEETVQSLACCPDSNYIDLEIYSHFEDSTGKKYKLNGCDCCHNENEILYIFIEGKINWYLELENGFPLDLKLIRK